MTLRHLLLLAASHAIATSQTASADIVDEVDPMTGAITLEGYGGHGLGKTFPGAATPFGLS